MGRIKTNLVYEYYVYDKETNISKCGFCDRQIRGHHGSNLLYHLGIHHPAAYGDVVRRNSENKGGFVLNDSDGTKTLVARAMENCNNTRSPRNLKEETSDQNEETEEYEGVDPLQSSDDDDEPPQKKERRSIKIELAQPSSSHQSYTPTEKHIKTYKLATQADKFDMLGKTVAMKLRDISAADDKQRLMAEKIINDTLFLAEMGQLTLAHCNRMNLE